MMSTTLRSPPKFATKTSRQAVAQSKVTEKTRLGTTTRGERPDNTREQEQVRVDEWPRHRELLQRVATGFLGRLRARRLQSQRSSLRTALRRRCLPALESALRACQQHKTRKYQWVELGQATALRAELLVLKRDVERQLKRLEEEGGAGTQGEGDDRLDVLAAALLAHSGGVGGQGEADADDALDSFEDTLLGARYVGIRRLQAHATALFDDRHPVHARLSAVEHEWRDRVEMGRRVALAVAEGDTQALSHALAQPPGRPDSGDSELLRRLWVAASVSARLLSLLEPCLLAGRFHLAPDNGPLPGETLLALATAVADLDEADTERLACAVRCALEKGSVGDVEREGDTGGLATTHSSWGVLDTSEQLTTRKNAPRSAAARWLLPLCPSLRVSLWVVCLRRVVQSGDWAALLHELLHAQDEGFGIHIDVHAMHSHMVTEGTGQCVPLVHGVGEGGVGFFERPVFRVLSWLRQEIAVYRGVYAARVLFPLLEAVSGGGGLGAGGQKIGEVGPEEVEVQPLYEALQRLAGDEGGCGLFLADYAAQAGAVYELRCAWRQGDWEGVGSALQRAEALVRRLDDTGAACVIRREVARAGQEMADYRRRQGLTACIEEEIKAARLLPPRRGIMIMGPEEEVGAGGVEGMSEASRRLMAEWGLLETARGLLGKRAWKEAYEWLGQRRPGTRLEPVWVWARQRVHYRLTQQRLCAALARGPVGGTAKSVDFSRVEPPRLAKAIGECRKMQQGANKQSQGLIDTAVLVCELRVSGQKAQNPPPGSRQERHRYKAEAGGGVGSPAAGTQSPNRRGAREVPRMAERGVKRGQGNMQAGEEEGEEEEEEEACLMRTWLAIEAVLFRHKARVEALLGALRRLPLTDHVAGAAWGEASPAGGRWGLRSPNVRSPPDAADDPFGDHPSIGESADPLRCRGELALLRAFAYFHRARGLLHHSLLSGNPSGLPDIIDLAPVTVGPLSDAVALGDRAFAAVLAASPTMPTAEDEKAEDEKAEDELARLLHWSGAMLRARQALLHHGWEGALSALEALEKGEGSLPGSPMSPSQFLLRSPTTPSHPLPSSPASPPQPLAASPPGGRGRAGRMEERAAAVLVNLRAATAHQLLWKMGREALLLPSSPSRSPSSSSPASPVDAALVLADRYGCRDAEARQLYVTLTCLQRLRTAVSAEDAGALAHALRHWDAQPPECLCPEAWAEVQGAHRLLALLTARDALRAVLADGGGRITGTVGALDLRGVETRKLREALAAAQAVLLEEEPHDLPPCVSMRSTLALARCVIELREGWVAGDMGRVEAALHKYDHHSHETQQPSTSASTSPPSTQGSSASADARTEVKAELALVSPMPVPASAQVPGASAEVALAGAEWFSVTVAGRFAAAVSEGSVAGPLGNVDRSAVTWAHLQSIAADYPRHSQHHALPPAVAQMARAAEALAGLRRAVAEERDAAELEAWVEQALAHCVNETGGAYPEVERVRQEAANDAARRRLSDALSTGGLNMRAEDRGAKGQEDGDEAEPSTVLVESVEVGELQAAVAWARELCPRGDDVARLLTLADHVLHLRHALLDGPDWALVRRSLAELGALGLGAGETRLLQPELMAVEEVEAAAALADAFRDALSSHAVARGPRPWSMELSGMGTDALDHALRRLGEWGEKWAPRVPPPDLDRLAHVAQTVRTLRWALATACDSTASKQAREAARGQVQEALCTLRLPASAQDTRESDLVSSLKLGPLMEELKLVEELVTLWSVERGVLEALTTGQAAYGHHTQRLSVDGRQLGVPMLVQAMDTATRLPLPPPEPLERLLGVAQGVLQLRRAVVAGEWAQVRELCSAPRGGQAAGGGEVGDAIWEREVQLARRLAAWRGLHDAVRPVSGETDREAEARRLAEAVDRVTAVRVTDAADVEALDWAQRLLHLRRTRADNDKAALRVAVAAILPPSSPDFASHGSSTTGLARWVLLEGRGARDELDMGAAAARLASALAFGNVSGRPLQLDMTHTQTRPLSDALANAQRLLMSSSESLALSTTTTLTGTFTNTGTLLPHAPPEQAELRRLVDVASAVLHLRSLILQPIYSTGAETGGSKDNERLRQALSTALPLLRNDRVPAGGVREEVELLHRHVLCTDLLADCVAAAAAFERPVAPEEERVYCAANVGEVDVDLSTIEVQPLQQALETAEAAMREDPEVRRALQPALTRLRHIAQARVALRDGRWAALESAVGALAAESQGELQGHVAGGKGPQPFDSLTRELGMFHVQLHVRRPLSALAEALARGGAHFLPGVVDVTSVDTSGLETPLSALRAVASGAGDVGLQAYGRYMTQRTRQTVDTVVTLGACVLNIRSALLRHDYTTALRLTYAALAEHRRGEREKGREDWAGMECVDKELGSYVEGLQHTLRFTHLAQCLDSAAAAGDDNGREQGDHGPGKGTEEAELDFLLHLAFGEGLHCSSDLGHVAALRQAAAALRRRRGAAETLQRLATDMRRNVLDLATLQQVVLDCRAGRLSQTAPNMDVVRDWLVALTSHESRLRAAVTSLQPQALHDAWAALHTKLEMQRWSVVGEGLNLWLVALPWPSLLRVQVLLASADAPPADLPQLLVSAAALTRTPTLKGDQKRPTYAEACRAAGLKPLSHCPVPIGRSVTQLEPELATIATRAFAEKVLALESSASEALEASWDVVRLGERVPPLRDELLCQLIMQLQGRMDDGGATALWPTLARCLRAFPPSPFLAPVVEAFLQGHGRTDLLGLLYAAALGPIGDRLPNTGRLNTSNNSNKYGTAQHPQVAALRSLLEAPLPSEAELSNLAGKDGATSGREELETALMRLFPTASVTRASLTAALQQPFSTSDKSERSVSDAETLLRPLLALTKAGGGKAMTDRLSKGQSAEENVWDAVIVPHCGLKDGSALDSLSLQDLARFVRLGRFEQGVRGMLEGTR